MAGCRSRAPENTNCLDFLLWAGMTPLQLVLDRKLKVLNSEGQLGILTVNYFTLKIIVAFSLLSLLSCPEVIKTFVSRPNSKVLECSSLFNNNLFVVFHTKWFSKLKLLLVSAFVFFFIPWIYFMIKQTEISVLRPFNTINHIINTTNNATLKMRL